MLRMLSLAALCLAALAGCETPLSEGLVIAKRFAPAHDETRAELHPAWSARGDFAPALITVVDHLPDRHLVTVNRYGRQTEIPVSAATYNLAEVGKHQSFRDDTCRTLPQPAE